MLQYHNIILCYNYLTIILCYVVYIMLYYNHIMLHYIILQLLCYNILHCITIIFQLYYATYSNAPNDTYDNNNNVHK